MPRLRFYLSIRIESQSPRGRRGGSRSQFRLLRRVKSLASDLFEDTCEYVVLIIFILVGILIAEVAIGIARAIAGEVPAVLEFGIYFGDASLLLKYIIHTYRAL